MEILSGVLRDPYQTSVAPSRAKRQELNRPGQVFILYDVSVLENLYLG